MVSTSMAAMPEIFSVSENLQNGHIVTITGTNLLDENTSNWFMSQSQSRCQGNSPAADGWSAENGGRYVSDVKLVGSKSMRFSLTGPSQTNLTDYVYRGHVKPIQYARAYVRYSSNSGKLFSTAVYVKMFYWIDPPVYIQPIAGSGWPTQMGLKTAPDTMSYHALPEKWKGDRWYCVEGMADNVNKRAKIWVDGQLIADRSANHVTDPYSFLLGFINAAPVPSGTYTMWTDAIALSTKRIYPITMIEIGNSSNYAAATKVKQELVHVADDRIEFKANFTGLGPGPYYIWVTNNRQSRSSTFSTDGSATAAPSPSPPEESAEPDETTILFEDWEDGNFNNFNDDATLGTFEIQSDVVHSGTKALRNDLQYNVHDTGWMTGYFGDNPYVGSTAYDDLTAEWYIFWSPGFSFPNGQKMAVFSCFTSWSDNWDGYLSYNAYYITVGLENGKYALQLVKKTDTGSPPGNAVTKEYYQNQGSAIPASTGVWQKIKVRFKLNTLGQSNGIIQMWINDNLKADYKNVNFRDSYNKYHWNAMMLTASASPTAPKNESMYWDDIKVSATINSDSTPPQPPTGLRIVE